MRYPSATCNEKWGSGPGQRLVMGYFDLLFKYAATDPVVSAKVVAVGSVIDILHNLGETCILDGGGGCVFKALGCGKGQGRRQ